MATMQHGQPAIGNAELERLYAELRAYVQWSAEDARRLTNVAGALERHFEPLVEDFYAEIARHPALVQVITSSQADLGRLKDRLREWLVDMCIGHDEPGFAARRWRIGWRHVELGVSQAYVNVALARLRLGLIRSLRKELDDDIELQLETIASLNKALDLDLAIIQHAFESEQLRKKTEATRLRSEIRFRNLVEAATCMIVILSEDGKTLYFSPFAEKLTGLSAEEMVDRDYVDACVPVEYRAACRHFWQNLSQGDASHGTESPVRGRDGQMRWLVWNARRIDDMDEGPAILLVGHDITARRSAEQRLVQAERLAAIGQMITGLAHESRNALQRINASTEMLEFEVEGNPAALELVHRSQKAIDDIHRLFDEVRNYAAPLHLDCQVQGVDSIWREAWELLIHLRRDRSVVFEEQVESADVRVCVDRFRLVQVFRNLLENALSACKDPARIAVGCRDIELEEHRMLEVMVRDNGPGFSAEATREALNPFYTTKTKGTGLGLAIVQRLVDAHGGTVELGGSPWGGAEIRLRLPRG